MTTLIKSNWSRQVYLMELRKLITYRADFWVNFFGQTIFSLTIAYFLWTSIFSYSKTEIMNGFTIQAMIFYYLIVPLIFRVQQGQGIGFISREIYDGSLSKYLLYPINLHRYKSMTYLANSTFFLMQLFLILILYNCIFYDPAIYSFSFVALSLFVLTLYIAAQTFFYLFSIIEFLAFWFDNIWSLGVILRFTTSFFGGALIPLAFFPDWARQILQFTPFPYLIDFPMNTLLGNFDISSFSLAFLISIVWLLIFRKVSLIVWDKGQYAYSGVGI